MIPSYNELHTKVGTMLCNVKYTGPTETVPFYCEGYYQDYRVQLVIVNENGKKQYKAYIESSVENEEFKFINAREYNKLFRLLEGKAIRRDSYFFNMILEYIITHDCDGIYNRGNVTTFERAFDIITTWWKPYPEEFVQKILKDTFHMSAKEIKYYVTLKG